MKRNCKFEGDKHMPKTVVRRESYPFESSLNSSGIFEGLSSVLLKDKYTFDKEIIIFIIKYAFMPFVLSYAVLMCVPE